MSNVLWFKSTATIIYIICCKFPTDSQASLLLDVTGRPDWQVLSSRLKHEFLLERCCLFSSYIFKIKQIVWFSLLPNNLPIVLEHSIIKEDGFSRGLTFWFWSINTGRLAWRDMICCLLVFVWFVDSYLSWQMTFHVLLGSTYDTSNFDHLQAVEKSILRGVSKLIFMEIFIHRFDFGVSFVWSVAWFSNKLLFLYNDFLCLAWIWMNSI